MNRIFRRLTVALASFVMLSSLVVSASADDFEIPAIETAPKDKIILDDVYKRIDRENNKLIYTVKAKSTIEDEYLSYRWLRVKDNEIYDPVWNVALPRDSWPWEELPAEIEAYDNVLELDIDEIRNDYDYEGFQYLYACEISSYNCGTLFMPKSLCPRDDAREFYAIVVTYNATNKDKNNGSIWGLSPSMEYLFSETGSFDTSGEWNKMSLERNPYSLDECARVGFYLFRNPGITDETFGVEITYEPDFTREEFQQKILAAPFEVTVDPRSLSFDLECSYASAESETITVFNNDEDAAYVEVSASEGAPFTAEISTDHISKDNPATVTVTPAEGLSVGTHTGTVTIAYGVDPESVSEGQDYVIDTIDVKVKITVKHVFCGGWCLKCDEYDTEFSGKFEKGDEKTYYRSSTPVLTANLLYDPANRDHTFYLYIDGNRVDDSNFKIYGDGGKAVVELKNSYILKLRTGKHIIRLEEASNATGKTHIARSWFRLSSAVMTDDRSDTIRLKLFMFLSFTGTVLCVIGYAGEIRKAGKHRSR